MRALTFGFVGVLLLAGCANGSDAAPTTMIAPVPHPLEEVEGCVFNPGPKVWTCEPDTDLIGLNLAGAELNGAELYVADLGGANLTEARLWGANLTSANLTGVDLYIADLTGANLTEATMGYADLTDADLSFAALASVTGWNTVKGKDTIIGLGQAFNVPAS